MAFSDYDFLEEPVEELNVVTDWPEGKIDPRLARTSYSSELTYHGCPRKYQLRKLSATARVVEEWRGAMTLDFGSLLGEAIQGLIFGDSYEKVVILALSKWDAALFLENDKQKKSFWYLLHAIDMFQGHVESGLLEDWEPVWFTNQHGDYVPATELGIKIKFPDGHAYRGYLDLVMKNKLTGLYAVMDVKSDSGAFIQPGKYKNSGQGIGYSAVLDKIAPGFTDFVVYYLVYLTKLERWELLEFPKTRHQRALWLRDRIWDQNSRSDLVRTEGNYGVWPMHGESCMSWNRECEYMGVCDGNTKLLTKPLTVEDLVEDDSPFSFIYDVEELL